MAYVPQNCHYVQLLRPLPKRWWFSRKGQLPSTETLASLRQTVGGDLSCCKSPLLLRYRKEDRRRVRVPSFSTISTPRRAPSAGLGSGVFTGDPAGRRSLDHGPPHPQLLNTNHFHSLPPESQRTVHYCHKFAQHLNLGLANLRCTTASRVFVDITGAWSAGGRIERGLLT